MGFKIYQTDDGRNMPLEYQPCGAITPKVGMALVMTGGKLVLASRGGETPVHQHERAGYPLSGRRPDPGGPGGQRRDL